MELLIVLFLYQTYYLIRSDSKRYCGGVSCFIRNDLAYNTKLFPHAEIENMFTENFLPHSSKSVLLK